MEPRIIGIAGPLQGVVFPLPEGEAFIGRESSNQLSVADAALSRRHCSILRTGADIRIRDLASRNGTRVNSVPITEYRLQHGDQLSIGSSLFVFLHEEPAQSARSNPVEFEVTTSITGVAFLLPQDQPLFPLAEKEAPGQSSQASRRVTGHLNALLKICTAIGNIRDRESLQWQLLGFVFDVIPAERGSVLFFDDQQEVSTTAAWDRTRGPEHPVPVSHAVIDRVLRERAGLIVTDCARDQVTRKTGSAAESRSGSLLCAPMIAGERMLGVIYLASARPTVQFDHDHLRVLQAVAHIAALALNNLNQWEKLKQENLALRAEITLKHDMVGNGRRMREVFEFIRKVAPAESTVLIQGESGTGKELVARAIHLNSPRAEHPFVAINCAAIAESLLESELFGHEKGSFTGAVSQKKGKMESADGGTLFLDEISELAPGLQAKLLRVLQEREFERVGGTKPIPLDIRLIAATNQDLTRAVDSGGFRKDLFYRLNVVSVTTPPLRERREDIPELAKYFLSKARNRSRTGAKSLSPEALACLTNYEWPGNVRELENAVERAAVLGAADIINPEDLPDAIVDAGGQADDSAKYYRALRDFKRQMIQQALQHAGGSYLEAARALGLHPNSLLRLMRNLNIRSASKGSPATS